MPIRHAALIALALTGLSLPFGPAHAQSEGGPAACPALQRVSPVARAAFLRDHSPEVACAAAQFHRFEAKPAREIMEPGSYALLQSALSENDCEAAYSLLINGFTQAYPDLPDILSNQENIRLWQSHIYWRTYPEVSFCQARRDVRDNQNLLMRRGLIPRRVRSIYEPAYVPPLPLASRNSGVARLTLLLTRDYIPAFVEMARLSEEGQVLKFPDQDLYYVLARAKHLGADDPAVDRLHSRVAARLKPNEIAALDKLAPRPIYQTEKALRVLP